MHLYLRNKCCNYRAVSFNVKNNIGKMYVHRGFHLSWQGSHSTWKTWKNECTWKNWKYHGILKNSVNIMKKLHETWKNLVATKNSPLTPLKQYRIH